MLLHKHIWVLPPPWTLCCNRSNVPPNVRQFPLHGWIAKTYKAIMFISLPAWWVVNDDGIKAAVKILQINLSVFMKPFSKSSKKVFVGVNGKVLFIAIKIPSSHILGDWTDTLSIIPQESGRVWNAVCVRFVCLVVPATLWMWHGQNISSRAEQKPSTWGWGFKGNTYIHSPTIEVWA